MTLPLLVLAFAFGVFQLLFGILRAQVAEENRFGFRRVPVPQAR